MAGLDEASANSCSYSLHSGSRGGRVYLWDSCTRRSSGSNCRLNYFRIMRSCQFVARRANLVDQISSTFERHINGLRSIVDDADSRNDQGWNDRQALFPCTIFVVQAIFTRDKGCARTIPAFDGSSRIGNSTAASPGPFPALPTRGFSTVPPWTS